MILKGYGIQLKRLEEDDIELVRQWRNSEHIRINMEFRDEISKSQQIKWFKSIDNTNNNYFIIIVDDKKIGLIYAAGIDWDKRLTKNGGIFIYEKKYWESKVALSASLLLTDTSILMSIDKSYVKILKTNSKAIAFNKALGYRLLSNQDDKLNQSYELTIGDYIIMRDKLRIKLFQPEEYQKIYVSLSVKQKKSFYFKRIQKNTTTSIDQFIIHINE